MNTRGKPHPCHPILCRLFAAGIVWIEGTDYVGRASDGIVVQVGSVATEDATEDYLESHPFPSDW